MKLFLPKISILIFFLLLISFFLSPGKSFAQTKDTVPPNTNVDANVPDNLHNWTQNVMIEVMASLSCQLTGIDPTNANQQCLGVDPKTGKIGFYPSANLENGKIGGAIGVLSNGITMLFSTPVHTSDYIQNLAQNFGITKKTYAQTKGTGFDGLKPILEIWAAFRNIVYLIFVIVFVAIGLAIMLRVKIDPRTVMSIQNQIPKIVIGILLVTFSYAIGGFLIDIMFLSIHVIGNIVLSADQTLLRELPTQITKSTNPFQAAGNVGANGGNPISGLWNIAFSPSKAVGDIVGSFIPLPSIFLLKGLFSWLAGGIAFLVIAVAILAALFKLWFSLIFAYVSILLAVVLAPFWIIGGIVPGSPINVSGWVRHLVANLAAFPATIAMFLLGRVFINSFSGQGNFTDYFIPPLIGNRISLDALGAIIGLGIILMTPNVINMLKSALKVPKLDTNLGKALGPGLAAPSRAIQMGFTHATMKEGPAGFMMYKPGAMGYLGRMLGIKG